MQPALIKYTTL